MSESLEDNRDETTAGQPGHQSAYHEHARFYDRMTGAYQGFRRAIVDALPARPGQVVLDVGCGTGLCFSLLLGKVTAEGGVIGVDESPDMVAMARERTGREGWRNVTVVQARAEDAEIAPAADAAIFCAVHDILQSGAALRNIVGRLHPGAPVVAGGGKWAAPWMVAVNLHAMLLHEPYVRSFEGFRQPWSHLGPLLEDVHIRELAFGSGYIMTGHTPGQPDAVRS